MNSSQKELESLLKSLKNVELKQEISVIFSIFKSAGKVKKLFEELE